MIRLMGGAVLLLAALTGCTKNDPAMTAAEDGGQSAADSGGNGQLTQLDSVRVQRAGATSQEDGARYFDYSLISGWVPEETLKLIEAHAYYVDESGKTIGATAEYEASSADPSSKYAMIRVEPSEPLARDAWYWFVVSQDATLSVRGQGNGDAARYYDHFFTGSAPHIIQLETDYNEEYRAQGYGVLSVYLSEPVELGGVRAGLGFYVDGDLVDYCIMQGVECWAGGSWLSEHLTIRVPPTQPVRDYEFVLADAISGSGRSFGEARPFLERIGAPGADGELRIPVSKLSPAARDVDVKQYARWREDVPPPEPRR